VNQKDGIVKIKIEVRDSNTIILESGMINKESMNLLKLLSKSIEPYNMNNTFRSHWLIAYGTYDEAITSKKHIDSVIKDQYEVMLNILKKVCGSDSEKLSNALYVQPKIGNKPIIESYPPVLPLIPPES